jgi:hypothetical protein
MEAVWASAVNLATPCCHTLLPNRNLRWEAIDDDVLVAEHVTRAVRIKADDGALGIKLVDVAAGTPAAGDLGIFVECPLRANSGRSW